MKTKLPAKANQITFYLFSIFLLLCHSGLAQDNLEKVDVSSAILSSVPIDIGAVENLFDGDTASLARSANVNPAWVQVEFPQPTTIEKIRVLVGQPNFAGDVDDWWLEAADSQDDLDNQTGTYELVVPTRTGVMGDWDSTTFSGPVTKKFWKIWVERTVGDDFVHMYEIEFLATPPPTDILGKVDVSAATISSTDFDIGTVDDIFDGDTTTLARSANINPAFILLEFPQIVTIKLVRVLLGQVNFSGDVNDWWLEAANSFDDLENQTGSYQLVVDTRGGVMGDWDTYKLPAPVSKKVWRIWVRRTVGDDYVHIPEIEFYRTTNRINGLPSTLLQFEGWTWRNLPQITLIDGDKVIRNKDFEWLSSNPSVAYVDSNGYIISLKKGAALICAKYKDLVSNNINVRVEKALRPIKHVTNDPVINVPAEGAIKKVPVLIISFVPTADNINVDRSYSPNLSGTTETIQAFEDTVASYIKRIKFAREQGSRFRNFKDSLAKPYIGYEVLDFITIYEPLPPFFRLYGINENTLQYGPDYEQIFDRLDVKDYVENKGVKEIWFWASGVVETHPGYDPSITPPENFRATFESNMSSPLTGDISNSNRGNDDLPVYDKSYVVIHNTHHRDQTVNMEPYTHQMEAMITYINERQDGNRELFWKKFVGNIDPYNQLGRCGWTHSPPNTLINYGYFSYIQRDPNLVQPVLCDNEDWKPDNSGEKTLVSYHNWEDKVYDWPEGDSHFPLRNELQWFIYWMQCIPGYENEIPYLTDQEITNWWDITACWDSVIVNDIGLYQDKVVTGNLPSLAENSDIIQVFPNPTTQDVTLDLGTGYQNISLKILSPTGAIIAEHKFVFAEKLQVKLPPHKGLYLLEINTEEGKNARMKVLKK